MYQNIGDLFESNQDPENLDSQKSEIHSLKRDPTKTNSRNALVSFASELPENMNVDALRSGQIYMETNHVATETTTNSNSGLENLSVDQLVQISKVLKSEIAAEVKELKELDTKERQPSHVTQQQLYKMSGLTAN